MKRTFHIILALSFVLYLSGMTFAQVKGGHGPAGAPEVHTGDHDRQTADHDRDVNHDKNHSKTENQEGHKDPNFEARIERNPELKSKIQSMLPAGTDLKTAASGFKNEGQFLATVHASKDLGIPFDQLKAKMMGSNPPMSLGQAIHALKPNLSEKEVDQVEDKAEKEARADEKIKPVTKPVT